MPHPDLDLNPPRYPFDRHWVSAWRLEQGDVREEYFYVFEIDLPNDDLGPMKMPDARSETEARARLIELGLTEEEIEARMDWAKKWMATLILKPGEERRSWLPPL